MESIKRLVKSSSEYNIQLGLKEGENDTIHLAMMPIYGHGFWKRLKRTWGFLKGSVTEITSFKVTNKDCMGLAEELWKMANDIPEIVFNIEKTRDDAILPEKTIKNDVGFDVYTPESFSLLPGERKLIDFGFKVETLPGYEIQMRNRSSMCWKKGTMMVLGVGTIDPDYRGHIMAPFLNIGRNNVSFNRGDRVSQMVIKRVTNVSFFEGKVNMDTLRNTGGFGSTGD